MSEHDDAYKAFKVLQEYCNKRNNTCEHCIFNDGTYCIADCFRSYDSFNCILEVRCRTENILKNSNLYKLFKN